MRACRAQRWSLDRLECAIGRIITALGTTTLTEDAILQAVGGNRALIRDALRRAVARGLVDRDGLGKPGHPYGYRVASNRQLER